MREVISINGMFSITAMIRLGCDLVCQYIGTDQKIKTNRVTRRQQIEN